jgi:hypothetical protein
MSEETRPLPDDFLEILKDPEKLKEKFRPVPPEFTPCSHTGCLHHVTHPCEGCGRIGGKSVKKKGW